MVLRATVSAYRIIKLRAVGSYLQKSLPISGASNTRIALVAMWRVCFRFFGFFFVELYSTWVQNEIQFLKMETGVLAVVSSYYYIINSNIN